jgi:hypothetical protein
MAKPKTQTPKTVVGQGGPLTPEQAYQLEVQRGLKARAAAHAAMTRMGGPPRPVSPPYGGQSVPPVVVDQNGLVPLPVPIPTKFSAGGGGNDPADVKAMQQFLIKRGYKIQADGILGPLTKAAAEDWRTNKNPGGWNKQQGFVTNPSKYAPAGNVSAVPPDLRPGADGGNSGAGGGGGTGNSFMDLLKALLGQASTSKLIPASLAGQMSAPDNALAAQLQQEIDQLPTAKQHALDQIAGWFGQVTDAQKTASQRDQAMANAGAAADSSNTAGIIASLGGSAMGGSNMIGATGANDANTLSAIGASDAQLQSDLAPLFSSEKANALTTMGSKFDQGLLDLQNQLATAQGNSSRDKAAALMQIMGANNQSRDSNFKNQASLLQTLAGLQISGMNADTNSTYKDILNKLHIAQANKDNAAAKAKSSPNTYATATASQKSEVAQLITKALVDTNTNKLKSGLDWPSALRAARNIVRTHGWDPLNPNVVRGTIIPSLNLAGVGFPNQNVYFQP